MADVQKFLDNLTGVPTLWAQIKSKFVAKEDGKGLSTEDFTTELKTRLEGIEAGAEVNQNAYAKIKFGETTIDAASKQDTFEFAAGDNVTITADASNKKLTFAATDTTYSNVTADSTGAAASGLMTSRDKYRLDNVADGAEVNQNAYSTFKVGSNTFTADSKTDTVEFAAGSNVELTLDAGNEKITISATDTTYEDATTTAHGLMSAADKVRLDAMDDSADANIIEGVQVNGTDLTPDSDKKVNVLIAEGTTDKAISVNGAPVAVHGLGTASTSDTESTVANDDKLPTGAAVQTYVTGLGYQTADQVNNLITTAISSAYIYKGSLDDEAGLPTSGQKVGDVYNLVAATSYGPAGMNVAWNGSGWDALGSSISIEAMSASDVTAICTMD